MHDTLTHRRGILFVAGGFVVFVVAYALSAPSVPVPAQVDPVLRSATFEQRFDGHLLTVVRVRTTPIVRAPEPEPAPPITVVTAAPVIREAPRVTDSGDALCRRHNLRKVWVSKTHWRCLK